MSRSIRFKNNEYLDSSSIVHYRKPLKDMLDVFSVSYANTNVKRGRIYFKKVGRLVQIHCNGDALQVPYGETTYIDSIDSRLTPIEGEFQCACWNNKSYVFLSIIGTTVKLCNYNAPITSATNFGVVGCYIAASD